MKITRNVWILSAISAMSLATMACSEDDVKNVIDDIVTCKSMCVGTVAVTCSGNASKQTDCAASEKTCSMVSNVATCVEKTNDDPVKCTASACVDAKTWIRCNADGTTATVVCKDGQSCTDDAKGCVSGDTPEPVPGECIDADYQPECVGVAAVKICENQKYGQKDCSATQACAEGACVDLACAEGEKIENHACVKAVEPTVGGKIGDPCKCEGDDCTFVITGDKIKDSVKLDSDTVKAMLPENMQIAVAFIMPVIEAFNEVMTKDSDVRAPNFFSDKITGCEGVTAPEGMTVGCFRTSKIELGALDKFLNHKNVQNLLMLLPTIKDKVSALAGVNIEAIVDQVKGIAKNGIDFTAANGYCLAAAIDIDVKGDAAKDKAWPIVEGAFAEGGLIDVINTGDHAKAKNAACPEGSVLLSYDIDKTGENRVSYLGEVKVGFDLCLQSCQKDSDCREKEGYSCVEMPNGVASDAAAAKVKVCFDKQNVDYFENMTKQFTDLIP